MKNIACIFHKLYTEDKLYVYCSELSFKKINEKKIQFNIFNSFLNDFRTCLMIIIRNNKRSCKNTNFEVNMNIENNGDFYPYITHVDE